MRTKKLIKVARKNSIDFEIAVYALTALFTVKGRKHNRKLRQILEMAVEQQLDFEKIREACLQTYLFAGFPKTLNALNILAEVAANSKIQLRDKPSEPEKLYSERGAKLFKKVYGKNSEKLLRSSFAASPELSRWMIAEGYGKTLCRPELDFKIRELCIISAIAVSDTQAQLYSHIKGALNVGVREKELQHFISFLSNFLKIHERYQLMSTFTNITGKTRSKG